MFQPNRLRASRGERATIKISIFFVEQLRCMSQHNVLTLEPQWCLTRENHRETAAHTGSKALILVEGALSFRELSAGQSNWTSAPLKTKTRRVIIVTRSITFNALEEKISRSFLFVRTKKLKRSSWKSILRLKSVKKSISHYVAFSASFFFGV